MPLFKRVYECENMFILCIFFLSPKPPLFLSSS